MQEKYPNHVPCIIKPMRPSVLTQCKYLLQKDMPFGEALLKIRSQLKLKPEEHDKKIEELFGIMLESGVKNALDIVSKMNDPHLMDDFHRFLVQYLKTIRAIPGLQEESNLHHELNRTLFSVTLPSGSVYLQRSVGHMYFPGISVT